MAPSGSGARGRGCSHQGWGWVGIFLSVVDCLLPESRHSDPQEMPLSPQGRIWWLRRGTRGPSRAVLSHCLCPHWSGWREPGSERSAAGDGWRLAGRGAALLLTPHTGTFPGGAPCAAGTVAVWWVPQLGARCSPGAPRALSPARDFHKPPLSLFSRWSCLGRRSAHPDSLLTLGRAGWRCPGRGPSAAELVGS